MDLILSHLLLREALISFATLQKAMKSPLVIQRQGAVNVLRSLSQESVLGEFLSVEQASEVTSKMCDYILEGPSRFIEQFGNHALTWQSFTSFGKFGVR